MDRGYFFLLNKNLLAGLLALLFVSFNKAHGQENYILYHKEILRCEQRFLFYDNIPAAIKEYKVVLDKYSKPFAKDCFIALQLACFINDKTSAEYFFKKSFSRGVTWTALTVSPCINKVLQVDKNYTRKIDSIYQKEHAVFLKSIDKNVREQVIRMKDMDDSFKMRMSYQKGNERGKREDDFLKVINNNATRIAELTLLKGFLGDNKVGFMDYSNLSEDYRKEFCYSLRSLIDQLYYHHGCCYFMHPEKLRGALENGDIHPAMYASIYEWAFLDLKEKRKELDLCKPVVVQTEFYNICPVLNDWSKHKDEKAVNKYRFAIGLASVDHYAKRKAFEKETGIRLLFGMFNIY